MDYIINFAKEGSKKYWKIFFNFISWHPRYKILQEAVNRFNKQRKQRKNLERLVGQKWTE